MGPGILFAWALQKRVSLTQSRITEALGFVDYQPGTQGFGIWDSNYRV